MPKELDHSFSELERKIVNLQKKFTVLTENHKDLLLEHEQMKKKYEEEKIKNQVLTEEQKNIKLYSAISGNPEYNRLMKNHINRLVKEVEYCIDTIQNNGL